MQTVYALLGLALIVLAVVDALWTTLWVDGAAGPVARRTSSWWWRMALRVVGRDRDRALSVFGPAILVGTVVLWVLLLWAGWVLLLASDDGSLINTSDGTSDVGWTSRIWFVAYAMFTMGNGDFRPEGGLWEVVAALVNASGMFLVTLAITYVLSVLSAVVEKRAFARQVTGLGTSPEALVVGAWNGRDLHPLDAQLTDVSSRLSRLTQQYQSYPVLQYYHATGVTQSPVKAVQILDEALSLVRFGVRDDARPDAVALTSARAGVERFIETLHEALLSPAEREPAVRDLTPLREHGIPTVGDEQFTDALHDLGERRRKLLGLVRGDGWRWEST